MAYQPLPTLDLGPDHPDDMIPPPPDFLVLDD